MEDTEFYKAKEELADFCQTYMDKKFESEKGLIKDYIGLGLKVAIAGVGIAVLTVGFFGLKTYDDVSKTIEAEIKSRFNNENPVAKYESLVKEAAVEGVIASLTARIQQREHFFSDEDALGFLTRALQDDSISAERKAQILDFGGLIPYTNNREQLARAARKLIQFDFKDNRESGVRVMSSLLKLYSASDPNQFVTDALNILENYKDESIIVRRVSELLDKMDSGSATRIVAKLASSDDYVVHFHRVMFDLRTNPDAQLDPVWFASTVQKVVQNVTQYRFDERDDIDVRDFLTAINQLKGENKNFWALLEGFATEAKKKDVRVVFAPARNELNEKSYVGLSSKSTTSILDLNEYVRLFSKIANMFVIRSSVFSKPTREDLSTLEFWMARQPNDSAELGSVVSYKPYFLYRRGGDIKSDSGQIIASDRLSQLLAIRVSQSPAGPVLDAYWRDPLGTIQHISSPALMGIEKIGVIVRSGLKDIELNDDL